MATILLKQATIVNEGKTYTGDILIKDGYIEKIASHISNLELKHTEMDCSRYTALPGLIDDQVHFREPGLTNKATISTESLAAAAGGVTSFIDQPNVKPATLTWELFEQKLHIAQKTSCINYGFNFGISNGNHDDVAYALDKHPSEIAALKIFMGSSTGNMLVDDVETLERIFQFEKLKITHCENDVLVKRNLQKIKDHYGDNIPFYAHAIIRDEEVCYSSSSQAVALAKKHKSRLHVYHITTKNELELFDSTLPLDKKLVTAEACMIHMLFTAKDYGAKGSLIKQNPSVKAPVHRIAIISGVKDNLIDVIATDHAPHTWEEKMLPYEECPSGAPMVQHFLPAAVRIFGWDNLPLIVQKACHNPAILFGIKDRGYLREGYYADITLVERSPWKVDKDNILYKCGWSPLEGDTLDAKVVGTFVNGELVYANRELNDLGRFFYPKGIAMPLEFTR